MSRNVLFPRYNQNTSTSHFNFPTSAAYCKLVFFWVHLQVWLDVTTSDFNTYKIPTYCTMFSYTRSPIPCSPTSAAAITRASRSSSESTGSRKPSSSCGPTGSSLVESGRVNVQAKQSGHHDYPRLPKSLIQMTSNRTSKMRWFTIVLKPHVLTHMQWHIFQESMQYASPVRLGGRRYGPIAHSCRNPAHMLKP